VFLVLGSKYGQGTPFETYGLTPTTPKFTFFFIKHVTYLRFPPFFLMSNEINLFKILYAHLKYLFFSFMNVKIIEFI
jgi:hypothetical protein